MNVKKQKKVVFHELETNYADFLIRLKYDNIKQGDFFRFLIGSYIQNNTVMLSLVEQHKLHAKTMGKTSISRGKKDIEISEGLLKSLGLTDSEKENIFDIIERKED